MGQFETETLVVSCNFCGEHDPLCFRPSELGKKIPLCTPCRCAYEKNWRDSRDPEVVAADRKLRSARELKRSREGRRKPTYDPKKKAAFVRLWRYGLTVDQYDQMVQQQNGLCANLGCGNALAQVDHDHRCCDTSREKARNKTCGKCVRGLLCSPCNLILGIADDSVDRLLGAVEYLQKWGC